MKALVVTTPFASYEAGDTISDTKAMKDALAESPHCVVPVKLTDEAAKAETARAEAAKAELAKVEAAKSDTKPKAADLPAVKSSAA